MRLKAIQILEAIYLNTKLCFLNSDSPLNEVISMAPAMFSKISKLLPIYMESNYFCKDIGRIPIVHIGKWMNTNPNTKTKTQTENRRECSIFLIKVCTYKYT